MYVFSPYLTFLQYGPQGYYSGGGEWQEAGACKSARQPRFRSQCECEARRRRRKRGHKEEYECWFRCGSVATARAYAWTTLAIKYTAGTTSRTVRACDAAKARGADAQSYEQWGSSNSGYTSDTKSFTTDNGSRHHARSPDATHARVCER